MEIMTDTLQPPPIQQQGKKMLCPLHDDAASPLYDDLDEATPTPPTHLTTGRLF